MDLVSLKGNGSVRTGCLYTRNSLPSETKSLLATSGPLKFTRGDAVLRPASLPLRMRNSGSGSFRLKFHLSPPRRVSAVTTPAINLPYCARYGISLMEMVSTESIGTLSPKAPVAGSDTSTEFTNNVLWFSPYPAMSKVPLMSRTTPGKRGSASVSVTGREGVSFT